MDKHHIIALMAATLFYKSNLPEPQEYEVIVGIAYDLYDEVVAQSSDAKAMIDRMQRSSVSKREHPQR